MKMYSLEDGRKQLADYQKKSNNYIKTCLGMKSPNQVLDMYLGVMLPVTSISLRTMSRSGSILFENLHLTLDIHLRVKCYQSLTPIHPCYLVSQRYY